MATMRMKYDYSGEDSRNILLNEEQNVDTTKFFKLLKDYDEPLWNRCRIQSKLSAITQVFVIKLDYKLSEISYDNILKWAKNILPKENKLKDNFYIAKSMTESLVLG